MDVLAVTDFPDVRRKALIKSAAGTLMIIPREGGYLFRMYVAMDRLAPVSGSGAAAWTLRTSSRPHAGILHPYVLDVKEVAWWSVYEVGQRLTDKFDDVPRSRGAGRARSAGVRGRGRLPHAQPQGGPGHERVHAGRLQPRLEAGRRARGAQRPRAAAHLQRRASRGGPGADRLRPDVGGHHELRGPRRRPGRSRPPCRSSSRCRAATRPGSRPATRRPCSPAPTPGRSWRPASRSAAGFHSAPVVRLADARPMHLGHVHEADGRWRLYAFADRLDVRDPGSRLRALCEAMAATQVTAAPVHRSRRGSGRRARPARGAAAALTPRWTPPICRRCCCRPRDATVCRTTRRSSPRRARTCSTSRHRPGRRRAGRGAA